MKNVIKLSNGLKYQALELQDLCFGMQMHPGMSVYVNIQQDANTNLESKESEVYEAVNSLERMLRHNIHYSSRMAVTEPYVCVIRKDDDVTIQVSVFVAGIN